MNHAWMWAALALTMLAVPATLAQSPEDMLVAKAQQKAGQAQENPSAFVQNQTSPGQVNDDARWAHAWACYAVDDGAGQPGVTAPDIPTCGHYKDVLGADKEKEKQKDVGEVEPLANDTLNETLAVVDDAVGTVERIVEDPMLAPDEALGFVGRVVRFVDGILEGIIAAMVGVLDELVTALGICSGENIAKAWARKPSATTTAASSAAQDVPPVNGTAGSGGAGTPPVSQSAPTILDGVSD